MDPVSQNIVQYIPSFLQNADIQASPLPISNLCQIGLLLLWLVLGGKHILYLFHPILLVFMLRGSVEIHDIESSPQLYWPALSQESVSLPPLHLLLCIQCTVENYILCVDGTLCFPHKTVYSHDFNLCLQYFIYSLYYWDIYGSNKMYIIHIHNSLQL